MSSTGPEPGRRRGRQWWTCEHGGAVSAHALLIGDPGQVGAYRLVGRLGAGGMGVVYLAVAPDGSLVALKLIRPEYAGDPAFRSRFRREVEAVQRVRGLCIARHLDAEVDGARPYLVTEYVDGPSLAEVVAQSGPLPDDRLIGLAVGLLEALIAIHAAGIVHRDLKPANVLLAADAPRVIDFGVAHADDATPMTQAGNVVGSAGWMAPEQATGHSVSPAVDVFAWASIVTFAATGRPPFGEGRPEAVMYRVVHHEPDLGALPFHLTALLRQAFDKSPAARPTPADLLASLTGNEPETGSVDAVTRMLDTVWAPAPSIMAAGPVLTTARAGAPPVAAPPRRSDPPALPPAGGPARGGAGPSSDRPWTGLVVALTVLVVAIAVGGIAWAMNRDQPSATPASTTLPTGAVTPTTPTTAPATTTTTPPTTAPTTAPTTVTTPVDAEQAWSDLQVSQPSDTVFSDVSNDGPAPAAVSASGRSLTVWSFSGSGWTTTRSIALPAEVDPGSTIDRADVTHDGEDDFVVTQSDNRGNLTGSVVSRTGGSWELVSFRDPARGDVRAVDELQLQSGELVSTSSDCGPGCRSGTTVDLTWSYDTSAGLFTVSHTSEH